MSAEHPVEPKSLGTPTVDQSMVVYRAMLEPTVRTFHAKMVASGYAISLSGAQRFIARHIKKTHPKPHQAAAVVHNQLTAEELSQIQSDLQELRPLEVDKLRPMFEREVLIYNIILLRFSQRSADRLAMMPKDRQQWSRQCPRPAAKFPRSRLNLRTAGRPMPHQTSQTRSVRLFDCSNWSAASRTDMSRSSPTSPRRSHSTEKNGTCEMLTAAQRRIPFPKGSIYARPNRAPGVDPNNPALTNLRFSAVARLGAAPLLWAHR